MGKNVLILESGGSKFITGVISEGEVDIKGKRKVGIQAQSSEEFLNNVLENMERSLHSSGYSIDDIDSVGAISAGVWRYKSGEVIPPNLSFGNSRIPLGRRIKERFEKPTYVENDVNAAVMAEKLFGYGKDKDVRILGYLTISTGIGLGLLDMERNELLSGDSGKAPEVGHNVLVPDGLECGCGGKGHWEAYGSGTGICKLAKDMSGDSEYCASTKELLEKASNGDDFALRVVKKVARYNAIGIGHIINQHQPGALIIGGTPVIKFPELMLEPVKELLNNPPCENSFTYIPKEDLPEITKTDLGCDNVAYGAASIALEQIDRNRVV